MLFIFRHCIPLPIPEANYPVIFILCYSHENPYIPTKCLFGISHLVRRWYRMVPSGTGVRKSIKEMRKEDKQGGALSI